MAVDSRKIRLTDWVIDSDDQVATVTAELRQDLFANLTEIIENKFVSAKAKQKLAAILDSLPEDEI